MENMDKLSEKKVEELKQEIKARLSDNYDEKENEEEKVSCEEIADEIRNIGTEKEMQRVCFLWLYFRVGFKYFPAVTTLLCEKAKTYKS